MSDPSVKRQRTNTVGASVATTTESNTLSAALKILPIETLRAVILQAAQEHADVAAAVTAEHDKIVAAEQARVIDFDYLSKSAWRALNVTYRRLKSSQQYEMAGEAAAEVRRCIRTIAVQNRAPASFGTRRSGLETLRKIGKSVALAGGAGEVLGREVVKIFLFDTCLESTMLRIARSFTADEREKFMLDGEFEVKLKELEELGRDEFIFEKLGRVRGVLLGVHSDVLDSEPEDDFDEGEKIVEHSESSESSESEESSEEDDDEDE
jgi:hypothetical protein